MLAAILKTLLRQLVTVCVVVLLLYAAFISLGRQFIPAVAGYGDYFEERILAATGLPVSINSVSGSWQQFSPRIDINGLRVLSLEDVSHTATSAQTLELENATLLVDLGRSLLQRRWVLENFTIDGLVMDFQQSQSGDWNLLGFSSGSTPVSIEQIFDTVQRVSRVELTNLAINLHSAGGNITRLSDGLARIHNRSGNHFIHVDSGMEGINGELALSIEVAGNSLASLNGWMHFDLPVGDYSTSVRGQSVGDVFRINELIGGGKFWVGLEDGRFTRLFTRMDFSRFGIDADADAGDPVVLNELQGIVSVTRRGDSAWQLQANDLRFDWEQYRWPQSDVFVDIAGDAITARADTVNLSIVSGIGLESGLVSGNLEAQLAAYDPRGSLNNLELTVTGGVNRQMLLRANTVGVAVASSGSSPAMWGIDGFLELNYDFSASELNGLAEVESDQLGIHLPRVFNESWEYDYVKGRLKFSINTESGQDIRMASDTIVAESDIVNGRVRFSSRFRRDGEGTIDSDLSLLVGGFNADVSRKSAYLPSSPNLPAGLLSSMAWVDGAVLEGNVSQSGVIFRDTRLPGSTSSERVFQGYFQVQDAVVQFDKNWPGLEALQGEVFIDGNDIDVQVGSGRSLDLQLRSIVADVSPGDDGRRLVRARGKVDGPTAAAIGYVNESPLQGLQGVLGNWQAEGNFLGDLDLTVPLTDVSDTQIQLDLALTDNDVYLPDNQLQFDRLTGDVHFATESGIDTSYLSGHLFDRPVELAVSSGGVESGYRTEVVANGRADVKALSDWPSQIEIARDILSRMQGELQYRAQLVSGGGDNGTILTIDSDLSGIDVALPEPFTKPPDEKLPLHIRMDVGQEPRDIHASLGTELAMRLRLDGDNIDGVVYAGGVPGIANPWQSHNESPGLEIRGHLDVFQTREWLALLEGFGSVSSPAATLATKVSAVDLQLSTLDLFGQRVPSVRVAVDAGQADRWIMAIESQDISGVLVFPESSDGFIEANFAFIHLPGPASTPADETRLEPEAEQGVETTLAAGVEEVERIDPFAAVDPRRFPRLKFAVGDIHLGEKSYGRGRFTMVPTAEGVEFTNLIAEARGLRLGLDHVDTDSDRDNSPTFSWHYDGVSHRSNLSGPVTVHDIATVLRENGYAPSLESDSGYFLTDLAWPGSPAFFNVSHLSGEATLDIRDGRFLQGGNNASGALKLISILNFDALMRRLRFSDDLLRRGLAYDQITGELLLEDGVVNIRDRLVISGPSSVYQIAGELDLAEQTIDGEMYVTLPVSDNIPWLGLLTAISNPANLQLAVGAYLFDRIFGDQVDSLTSAQYILQGSWENLEPEFRQAFGSPEAAQAELQSDDPLPAQ